MGDERDRCGRRIVDRVAAPPATRSGAARTRRYLATCDRYHGCWAHLTVRDHVLREATWPRGLDGYGAVVNVQGPPSESVPVPSRPGDDPAINMKSAL